MRADTIEYLNFFDNNKKMDAPDVNAQCAKYSHQMAITICAVNAVKKDQTARQYWNGFMGANK